MLPLGDWQCVDAEPGRCRYVNEPQDAEIVLRWNADAPVDAIVPYDIEVRGHVSLFDDTEFGDPEAVEGVVHTFMELFGGPAASQPDLDPSRTAAGGAPE